jgi:hypothetical protein
MLLETDNNFIRIRYLVATKPKHIRRAGLPLLRRSLPISGVGSGDMGNGCGRHPEGDNCGELQR